MSIFQRCIKCDEVVQEDLQCGLALEVNLGLCLTFHNRHKLHMFNTVHIVLLDSLLILFLFLPVNIQGFFPLT